MKFSADQQPFETPSFSPVKNRRRSAVRGNFASDPRPADWNVLDDSLADNQRWSTWPGLEKLMRGPRPYPSCVIEDAGAVDTNLGVLKTGKEADVFLVERATETRSVLLVAKRYRSAGQQAFHRSSVYGEGRSVRRSRDARAIKNGSTYGRAVEASRWANAEWTYLCLAHANGLPVPYPVQIDGTEIMMEFIADPESSGIAAPRLQSIRPDKARLECYWEQVVAAMAAFARLGFAHGDLSPLQRAGRRRTAGGHRPAAAGGPGRKSPGGRLAGPGLPEHVCLVRFAWLGS